MEALIVFVNARLGEHQEAAEAMQRVYPTPWDVSDRGWMARVVADAPYFLEVIRLEQEQAPNAEWLGGVINHVRLHAPDNVLADVDAKRRIIALHVPGNPDAVPREGYPGWPDRPWFYCETCGSGEPNEYPVDWPCATLRLLALPYADHPDYRQEWKP